MDGRKEEDDFALFRMCQTESPLKVKLNNPAQKNALKETPSTRRKGGRILGVVKVKVQDHNQDRDWGERPRGGTNLPEPERVDVGVELWIFDARWVCATYKVEEGSACVGCGRKKQG